ncbi:MAG: hypothetical protein M3442_16950, partial [Chloroflexota bacterium]|nr:hypothetical protein [Chloroflexota bacterium]
MPGHTVLIYHPLYNGRGFSPVQRSWGRYRAAWNLFEDLRLFESIEHVQQRPAPPEALLSMHSEAYVEHVRRRDAEGTGFLDQRDTAAWRGVFERTLVAVGGTLEGVALVGSGAATHVFNPGGGLHHAHRDRTAGFCIFNDVALAVHRLQDDFGLRRVAVVDVDGHHGDGTQELLYDQPVLKLSLHQYDGRFFPGTGSIDEVGWGHGYGYSVNVGLPRHVGDAGYVPAFRAIVPRALRAYRPDVILLNFGVDGHFADPLVRLWLTTATYRTVAATVHDLAHELCAGRLIVCGSGGYDPRHVARCWATLLATLTGDLPPLRFSGLPSTSLCAGGDGQPEPWEAGHGTGALSWPGRFAPLEDRDVPVPEPATLAAALDT